ncbi:MAG: hypothetical protein BM485_08145 [Desulfobulbaceae bacterium DB1]|nr:MAG: hypothetical protein BM485_08145 [Desulfobulbaceae bacterium DB1]
MRTTLNTIYNMIGTNLGKITTDMERINRQISSGMQMSKLSDNPVNMVSALGMRSTLAEISQYQTNISFGGSMISAAEQSLTGIKQLVMDSKNQTLIAANDSQTPSTRLYVADEVHVYLEQMVTLANTRWDGKYVFGGYRTTGYTELEPTPFMLGYIDGYRINGADLAPLDYVAAGPPLEYQLLPDDLVINGIPVTTINPDGLSDVYDIYSAAAKADAVNAISEDTVNALGETIPGTGVTASVVPAFRQATMGVSAGTMDAGDLIINGIDVFAALGPTTVTVQDTDNVMLNAINDVQAQTGIVATRDANGKLALKAVDGRNLHVETTVNGNDLTHLNDAAADKVYFGSIQLSADRTFVLESTLTPAYPPGGVEPAFSALGLSGGSLSTGEKNDIANDGKLSVHSLTRLDNNVRYTGDRDNDAKIKVGAKSTIEIAKNGEDAISNTDVFKVMKELENYLRGQNYTFVTGIHAEENRYATLEEINAGKDLLDEKFHDGNLSINVTDHDVYPPEEFNMLIPVDITKDTPYDIAVKLNGIPGLSASWDSSGHLRIESSDPNRYTFDVSEDSSNTLNVFGINANELQHQGLTKSLEDLDNVMSALSSQIADFGARANRITIQTQVYANLELANQENLSEKQDTDLTEAILNLKSKEVAYQAALAAAAKTMQLSLVDYL